MRWRFLMPAVFAATLIALSLAVVLPRPASAQIGTPATGNIRAVDGPNPGEVVISWDVVAEATHYRVGYVNLDVDRLQALARGAEWIEAFVYVDVAAANLPVSGGRTQYVIRRLAQGQGHAFTVLTSKDYNDTGGGGRVSSTFSWPPKGSRWARHVVADRGGACPGAVAASASVATGSASSGVGPATSASALGGSIGQGDPGPPPDVPFERRHITLGAPAIGAPYGETGNGRFAGQMYDARVAAQAITPATGNIRAVDGPNPGEVVISWDVVAEATHYRVGYVNLDVDRLQALARGAEWIEAFVYVDVAAANLPVSGGRTQYVIRRLAQGQGHAFTVLTSKDYNDTGGGGRVSSTFSWPPKGSRWARHVVADRGGACPTTGVPTVTPPAVVTSLDGLENGAWLEQNRPQAAADIRALPWVRDGINGSERQTAEALIATAIWYSGVFNSLMQMSWLGDGVTDAEAIATAYIRWTAFFDSESPGSDLAGQMLQKSWVRDAVSTDEATVIRSLYWTISYDTDSPPSQHVNAAVNAAASRILTMPFLASVESPDALAVRSLERIAGRGKTDFLEVMSRPTLNDGITDEEAEIVLLLGATYQYADSALIDTLLDPTRITVERRAIRLPRSGEVELAIIRTAPGPARSMDLLEHSVRGIEEFMGASFPTNYIAALFAEEAVLEGAAGVNFGTHVAMLPEYDVDDGSHDANFLPSLTTHEVAHYYWRANESWIDEGGATFMEFAVEKARTGRGLIADRYPCAHVSSIAQLVVLDPEREDPENICNYSLGERIFLDLYRNLGEAVYRRGFSSLYQRSQVLDEYLWPTYLDISHVREAFQPLAPAATPVIARWYDGTEPYDLSHLDTGPVDPSLPGINGRITEHLLMFDSNWPDGPGIDRFSAAGVDELLLIRLTWTFPRTSAPKVQLLEYVEYYEDGFAFRRQVWDHTFDPSAIGARTGRGIGFPPDEKWATGRYWVYVYDGDRKVAEVTYEVLP